MIVGIGRSIYEYPDHGKCLVNNQSLILILIGQLLIQTEANAKHLSTFTSKFGNKKEQSHVMDNSVSQICYSPKVPIKNNYEG